MMMPTEGHDVFGAVAAAPAFGDVIDLVVSVHHDIERHTHTFQERTQLRCPEGCGRCCLSPHVETTIGDLLPLAEEVVRRGRAGELLDRLDDSDDPRCALYEPDPHDSHRGRCSMYEWRPSICRLFGFAGRRDADGQPQFVPCRVHSEVMPMIVGAAKEAVRRGEIPLPIYSDLAGQIAAIASGPAGRPQPINSALREAMQRVALLARLAENEETDGAKPTTPRCPRRAA